VPDRRIALLAVVIAVIVVVAGVAVYLIVTTRAGPGSPGAGPSPTSCETGATSGVGGNWTTYHGASDRSGFEAGGPVTTARAAWSGPFALDGQVYAEPLVCGDVVYVATEDDSVYAINATSGAQLWRAHLGTPVPGSDLPCGDINPSGITGTPVIDLATGTIYAVAYLAPDPTHELFALDLGNGSIRSSTVVNPPGVSPTTEQQRGALALANGYVYVPYGGLDGDCGQYHGYVEGAPVAGGSVISYQVPTQREGAIWGPAGIAVAPNGTLYVSTGNGASTTTFDFGDSVIELTPGLSEVDYFAPVNWAQLNRDDTDLGSVAPTLLPDGDLFQIGKAGVGYVIDASHLGGIGGQLGENPVCAGAYGGTARVGAVVLVPCDDGLYAVSVTATNLSTKWGATGFDAGSPVVTGNVVWSVNISTGVLLGLNLSTGALQFSFPLAGADHFISPTAAPGAVFVAGGSDLYEFALA
jgi:outer membrane protein assembly factor BamB